MQADKVLPLLNPGMPSDVGRLVIRRVHGCVGEDVVLDIVSNKEVVDGGVLPSITGAHGHEDDKVGGDGSNTRTAEVEDVYTFVAKGTHNRQGKEQKVGRSLRQSPQ